MPCLQFLNGSRDQQFEELNPSASLVIGSGGDAHIRVSDAGVEAKHCQVYPAQGAYWLQDMGTGQTIFNFKRLASATEALKPGDVFIVGRTYFKFWEAKPAGGEGGGADPAALEGAKQQATQLQSELEAAKQQATQLQGELDGLKSSAAEAEQAKQGLEGELESARQQQEQVRGDLQAKEARVSELEAEVSRASEEAERRLAEAQEEARRGRAEVEGSLEATRAALESLRGDVDARARDRLQAAREPSDLEQALAALALPDALRRRLEQAVETHVDREVLRRAAGPVVPLRDLTLPGSERDLAAEVAAVRLRGEQVDAARRLGLHELEAGEVERLLEIARG